MMMWQKHPAARLWDLIKQEKKLIYAIYFYAIMTGLIQLSLPVGIQSIINFVLAGSFSVSMAILIALVVIGVFVTGMLQVNQMKIIETIQQSLFVRYAYAFAERIPRIDLKIADNYYLPELVNRFFEIPHLQKSFSKLLLDVPLAIIQILFGLMLLSFYHSAFILFGVVLMLLLWLMIAVTGKKGLQTSFEASQNKYGVAAWLEELARMVKTFKFSKGSAIHIARADAKTDKYLTARTQHFSILLLQYKVLIVFKTLITAAMLIVGSFLLLNQQMNIGQFIAAEIVILTVIAAVEKIIGNLDGIYMVMTSVDKIAKVTEKPVEEYGTYTVQPEKGLSVSFNHLSFAYQPDNPVLRQLSFDLPSGNKVCIQGKHGSGKSTVLKLMTGAYLDFKGSLLVNNVQINNYDLASLRSHIGIYLNNQDIFQGTLLDNITMGNKEVNLEHITTLAQQIGLYDFIVASKDGLNTPLHASGKQLPANIVHKILLIRALINNPKLILLEEPFALLEEPYKSNLKKLLLQMDATVVVATHDKDFTQQCHKIIHLN